MWWVYLAIGILADTANIYIAKRLVDTGNYYWLIGVVATILMLNLAFIMALREGPLSIITSVWLVAVLLGSVLMGVRVFNESVSLVQWVGIVLAISSIILLQWPTKA